MKTLLINHLAIAVAVLNCLAFPLLAAQNKPPVANNDSYSVNANTTLTVPAPGVLANDTDQNGDSLTAVLVGNVSHGTLQLHGDGSFTYTPANKFSGTDGFVYKANDGKADSGLATVTFIVSAPANHAPVVGDFSFILAANNVGVVSLVATDVDGDPLTFRIIQLPGHGTLTQSVSLADYTPSTNFVGNDSFTYVANDGKTDSNPGVVTLKVLPIISINNVSVLEGNFVGGVATFTVSLAPPSPATVTVNWNTEDETALASSDYTAASGTLTFTSGVQQQTIKVSIVGDRLLEPDETFKVRLASTSAAIPTSVGRCTILNDDTFIGVTEGIPPEAIVKVGERFTYGVKWTHPVRWRLLDTVDIRITDDEGDVLYVRFHEPSNTYSLFNPANQRFMRPALPGSRTLFETPAATMDLQDSNVVGTGPDGPSVTLKLGLSFKPKAAGRVFRVEAFATDDDGNQQGFDEAGNIAVLRR